MAYFGCQKLQWYIFHYSGMDLINPKGLFALGSQKPEAHYSELLGFWLMRAVWLL